MQQYHSWPMRRKSATGWPESSLPLFDWADAYVPVHLADTSPAMRMLSCRYRLAPHFARLVAEHAGFAMENCHE